MTEYDYSPEARERYIAKQHAIARWVDSTNRYEPANPFLPSESPGTPFQEANPMHHRDVQEPGYDDGYYRSSSRHHRPRDDRDHQRRPNYDRHDSHQSRTSSRQNSRSSSSYPSRPHTSQSHYPYESSPLNGQPYQHYSSGQQQHHYTHATQSPYGSSSSTPFTSPQPHTPYEQPSNIPTLVPINGGAGGYVLVPPKGTSYQVVQTQSPSPTQPWYKRVFSPPASDTGARKLSKSSSSGSRRGRSSRWSLDIY